MATPENEAHKPEQEPLKDLLPAKDQPSALIEDEETRSRAIRYAGVEVWEADEVTVALVEAALLPKGSEPPPWLDDTGMKLIGLLKERADKYIQAQRKARAHVKKSKERRGLKIVPGGRRD